MSMRRLIELAVLLLTAGAAYAANPPQVRFDWSHPKTAVKTQPAMEVCVEPPMLRGRRTHDGLYRTLADFNGEYSRLAFWFPYPKMAVAELDAPTAHKTSWDFAYLDQIVADFMQATQGRSVMVNFSTIPEWMFKTRARVPYADNVDQIDWNYEQGVELRDPSLREVRDYFVRLFNWYTQGGFTDELGQRHESGHHYKFTVWEVLNEVDFEHHLSPELYTRIYDEVVEALRKLDPQLKFSGPALAHPMGQPQYVQYFLDPSHHKPGIPLDFVSYHFYAAPDADESAASEEHTFFKMMDGFLATVRSIELERQRLTPRTRTFINELGTMSTDNFSPNESIPESYWALSSAAFAYAYLNLVKQQIDLVGGAELINYPTQVPGASLTDWNTGEPNARYRGLKLLSDAIRPGDRLVDDDERDLLNVDDPSTVAPKYYAVQGFLGADGGRKVVLVNKRSRPLRVQVAGAKGGSVLSVDLQSNGRLPTSRSLASDMIDLQGFAVAVVHLGR